MQVEKPQVSLHSPNLVKFDPQTCTPFSEVANLQMNFWRESWEQVDSRWSPLSTRKLKGAAMEMNRLRDCVASSTHGESPILRDHISNRRRESPEVMPTRLHEEPSSEWPRSWFISVLESYQNFRVSSQHEHAWRWENHSPAPCIWEPEALIWDQDGALAGLQFMTPS